MASIYEYSEVCGFSLPYVSRRAVAAYMRINNVKRLETLEEIIQRRVTSGSSASQYIQADSLRQYTCSETKADIGRLIYRYGVTLI